MCERVEEGEGRCEGGNAVRPERGRGIRRGADGVQRMDNMFGFSEACAAEGLRGTDRFEVTDLVDRRTVGKVLHTLETLKAHHPTSCPQAAETAGPNGGD